MATTPEADEYEPTRVDRVRRAVEKPLEQKQRPVTLLAISAGLASFGPQPIAAVAVVLLVGVAADMVRRR